MLRNIIEKYKKEQPVIDSERQLSGKVVDEEVRSALERSDNMTPEHLRLIDAIMTLPETSLDKEMQRRIMAINAVTVYCGVEEGTSYRSRRGGRPVGAVVTSHEAKMSAQAEPDTVLQQAKLSVRTDQRPLICFLCVGNPSLPWRDQVKRYATVGSLSRHFRRHVTKLKADRQIDCRVCNVKGMHRMHSSQQRRRPDPRDHRRASRRRSRALIAILQSDALERPGCVAVRPIQPERRRAARVGGGLASTVGCVAIGHPSWPFPAARRTQATSSGCVAPGVQEAPPQHRAAPNTAEHRRSVVCD